MVLKYNIEVDNIIISNNLKKITNKIYKLLPNREENVDWEKPLQTIIEELAGMNRILLIQHEVFFSLLCKLEGLFILTNENDFLLFRRTIFDCLSLINILKNNIDKEI